MSSVITTTTLSIAASGQSKVVDAGRQRDSHPAYRPDIDGLRALAVVGVVIYHAFPDWLPGGFAGVDVFFVISGFLISTIVLKSLKLDVFSLGDFYARRINRLFPVLIVVLIFTLATGAFVLLPPEYAKLGKNTVGGSAFIANIMLGFDVSYFAGIAELNPLLHLWSLGIEEQFYLIWPLVLWFAWQHRLNLGGVMTFLVVTSFFYSLYMVDASRTWAFYSPAPRFWELGVDGLLAWFTLNPPPTGRVVNDSIASCLRGWGRPEREPGNALKHVTSLIGAVMIVVTFCLLTTASRFPGQWALMPVIGSALIISAGPRAVVNRLILSNRLMVGIGLISYPLYLWHWPMLSLMATVNTNASQVAARNSALAGVLVSLVLAWLSYRYVETPLRRSRHRLRIVGILSVGMMAVAAELLSNLVFSSSVRRPSDWLI